MADIRVELLVVQDCPHLEQARRDLQSVLARGIIEVPIQLIYVGSLDDAEFLDFPGSPTIRINGDDVVPEPDLPVGLACRMYRGADGGLLPSPPIEAIRAAVDAHRRDRLRAFQQQEAAKVAEFARNADAAGAEFAPDGAATEASPGTGAPRPEG